MGGANVYDIIKSPFEEILPNKGEWTQISGGGIVIT